MEDVKDWAIDCLKKAKTGCQEGGKRKKTVWREQVKGWAADCLKKPRTGHHRGEGKKITLRVIELGSVFTLPRPSEITLTRFHLGSVKVEEYEVWGDDGSGP